MWCGGLMNRYEKSRRERVDLEFSHDLLIEFAKVFSGHRHGICLVAGIFNRLSDECTQLIGFDAMFAKLCVEAQASEKVFQEGYSSLIGLSIGALHDIQS